MEDESDEEKALDISNLDSKLSDITAKVGEIKEKEDDGESVPKLSKAKNQKKMTVVFRRILLVQLIALVIKMMKPKV